MMKSIFILGCPRSGTTLLASLLNNTGNGRPVETHFITKYFKKLESYGDISVKKNFSVLMKDILAERPVMQWNLSINVDEFYDELNNNFSYNHIVDQLCMKMARKKGFEAWGDKTPHYLRDIGILFKLFPDSKYIYIVRDGRDVALSLLEKPWGPNNIFTCAEVWRKYNAPNEIIEGMKQRNRLYFIRYEDLLDNAARIVPDIYKFLDEEYNESKMRDLIGRIRKGNYGKWKSKMNTRQIKLFESVAANTLERFGYETSYEESDIGGLTKAVFNSHELFMRAKFLFKTNVIDGIKIKFLGKEPFAD